MSTKAEIVAAIDLKCGPNCKIWRIGLTHDPIERKRQWQDDEGQNVRFWSQWSADCLSDAEEIEADYIGKGMKGGTGGNLSPNQPVYIYVF